MRNFIRTGVCAMKQRISLSLSAVVLTALVTCGDQPASAVWFNPRGVGIGMGVGYGLGGYGYGGGLGYGYGYGGYGGGTAAGNYMQGMSQVIRSQGEYNEQTTKAYINYEDARSKYIDNQKKWTETYFAMREQNQAKQAEKSERNRRSRESMEQVAHSAVPKPLSSEVLDPITGKISWPELLTGDEYAESRKKIESLLELRATTSGGGAKQQLFEETQKMISTLKGNIQNLPSNTYISARKFLDRLLYTVTA
jgi:hypothetical protein